MTGERGSGTVLAAGLVAVIATLLLAGLLVAAVAVAGQRARTAADLAALAGAGEAVTGADEVRVCEVARQVAARNGAGTVV
ncbi:Rv3654c family TadE-like protein, partial [Bacillus subtilis]|uniref:Rv3654c family TadE-like protein n=1 Tax=Bacillus subtilis TaxID=1423 RepID=UPI003C137AF7